MAKDLDTTGNGVTTKIDKSGATIHIKWAVVATLVGATSLFGGRAFLPGGSGADQGVETVQQTLDAHCKAQTVTEGTQREQMVELRTKLDAMREDLRDIKQMMLRTQRVGEASVRSSKPDS